VFVLSPKWSVHVEQLFPDGGTTKELGVVRGSRMVDVEGIKTTSRPGENAKDVVPERRGKCSHLYFRWKCLCKNPEQLFFSTFYK
jgi:hypothetical protein